MTLSNLARLAASLPWAMEEAAFLSLLEIANRQGVDPSGALMRFEARLEALHSMGNPPDDADLLQEIEAVSMKDPRRIDSMRKASMRGNVAVVPIVGPMFRYANLFTMVSGATSLNVIATDFQSALDDPTVEAILLSIDSPGGQVNGVGEFADAIYAARGAKPMAAYVSDAGCSAAYWVASAAPRVIVAETAQLGSIGCMMAGTDTSQRDAAQGVRAIKIISSQSPSKNNDPTTPAGQQAMQATCDALAAVFINAVARNRGVSSDTVVKDFGGGGVMVGQAAVAAGLADQVGTFEQTLAELAAARPGTSSGRPAARAAYNGGQTVNNQQLAAALAGMTAGQFREVAPDLAMLLESSALSAARPKIETDAVTAARPAIELAAATAERERILGIQAHGGKLPGHADLVAKLIAEPTMTADRAAGAILAAEGEKGGRVLDTMRLEERNGLHAAPLPTGGNPGAQGSKPWLDKGLSLEARCKAKFDAVPAVRSEFGSLGAFVAFEQALENGSARIHKNASASSLAD